MHRYMWIFMRIPSGRCTMLERKQEENGTSATTFSPDADCTRAQIVTFLYRALADK